MISTLYRMVTIDTSGRDDFVQKRSTRVFSLF
jgi:hypothetical protein